MNPQHSKVDIEHMLVLGAGQLGMAVIRELAPRRQNAEMPLTALISPKSLEAPNAPESHSRAKLHALGAQHLPIHCAAGTTEDLTRLCRRFRTVISCIGFDAGPGTQTKLTRAALAAGLQRNFPWQFGGG